MFHVEIAPRIIDCYERLAGLIRLEDIFLKVGGDSGAALIDAAPCADRMFTSLIDVSLEVVAHLADNEHLFVFHDALSVVILEESLNMILHFSLGPLVHLMTHKLETRREDRGQHE